MFSSTQQAGWYSTGFFITGVGGGIGEGTALRLNQEGTILIINDISHEGTEGVTKKIENLGGSAVPVSADVSDYDQVKGMVDQIYEKFKAIDILVNNARLYLTTRGERVNGTGISVEEWNRFLSVNLSGAFYRSKYVMPFMRGQRHGNIVNIPSQAANTGGLINAVHYGASKAGLIGLIKRVARENASSNFRINCVCPGRISTPDNLNVLKSFHEKILEQIPLHRVGTVEEIAQGVLFLISEASGYITGASLDIN